jgi:hypothetical protein
MLIIVSAFLIMIPSVSGDQDYNEFKDSLAVMRVSFILTYIVFASGLVI